MFVPASYLPKTESKSVLAFFLADVDIPPILTILTWLFAQSHNSDLNITASIEKNYPYAILSHLNSLMSHSNTLMGYHDTIVITTQMQNWGPRWQSGNTLASHLCGRGSIPVMAVSGKAGSWLPLVGSLQYRTLANYMYWFPLPFQLPVVI